MLHESSVGIVVAVAFGLSKTSDCGRADLAYQLNGHLGMCELGTNLTSSESGREQNVYQDCKIALMP